VDIDETSKFMYETLLSVRKGNPLPQLVVDYAPVHTAEEGVNRDGSIVFNM
jgi:hypothetical protein